jgi:hypothetical protein
LKTRTCDPTLFGGYAATARSIRSRRGDAETIHPAVITTKGIDMTQAIAYLAFDGNCAQAMRYYERALRGKL